MTSENGLYWARSSTRINEVGAGYFGLHKKPVDQNAHVGDAWGRSCGQRAQSSAENSVMVKLVVEKKECRKNDTSSPHVGHGRKSLPQ